jgi:hypothetical protein
VIGHCGNRWFMLQNQGMVKWQRRDRGGVPTLAGLNLVIEYNPGRFAEELSVHRVK